MGESDQFDGRKKKRERSRCNGLRNRVAMETAGCQRILNLTQEISISRVVGKARNCGKGRNRNKRTFNLSLAKNSFDDITKTFSFKLSNSGFHSSAYLFFFLNCLNSSFMSQIFKLEFQTNSYALFSILYHYDYVAFKSK